MNLRCALFACLAFLAALPGVRARAFASEPPAAPREFDLASYRVELDRLSGIVADLPKHPAAIATLRGSLPRIWRVRGAGETFDVPTGWLDSALGTMAENAVIRASLEKDVLGRLAELKRQAEALEKAPPVADAEQARAKLDSILSRREFRGSLGPTWWEMAQQRLWDWVVRMLQKLFGRIGFGGGQLRSILVWSVIVLAFSLLVGMAARVLRRASRAEALGLGEAPPRGKTWRDWTQEALASATRGDYRAAVHAAYWAGVYRLAELGVWQLDRSRTPREYLRVLAEGAREAIAKPPALGSAEPPAAAGASPAQRAAALVTLTRAFEITWYGYEPATLGDFRNAVTQLEALGCRFPSNLAIANS